MNREELQKLAADTLKADIRLEETLEGGYDIITNCWIVSYKDLEDLSQKSGLSIESVSIDGSQLTIRVIKEIR